MSLPERAFPFDAILFDCDGVLVDSEPVTAGVLAAMLAELGWVMTVEETMRLFTGKAVKDEAALIEARTGFVMTTEWLHAFWARRNQALAERLQPVPGAVAAVRDLHLRLDGRIACASGADRRKVELQLAKVGLSDCFEGRIFSGHELPRSKPFPDVYLAAAAALDVDPARCAVIEDSVTGAAAGVAAGATVFGFSPPGSAGFAHAAPQALIGTGAVAVFADMGELPRLLAGYRPVLGAS